jgi:hypothetical protein
MLAVLIPDNRHTVEPVTPLHCRDLLAALALEPAVTFRAVTFAAEYCRVHWRPAGATPVPANVNGSVTVAPAFADADDRLNEAP